MELSKVCESIVDCEHQDGCPITQEDGYPLRFAHRNIGRGYFILDGAESSFGGDCIANMDASSSSHSQATSSWRREAPVGNAAMIRTRTSAVPRQSAHAADSAPTDSKVRTSIPVLLPQWSACSSVDSRQDQRRNVPTPEHGASAHHAVAGIPPLPVQRRIAGILSAYDELIENSQRRIRILEAMARALYREWFVHFRFPGHENHPRVASPLGEIPEGWEVKKLGDVLELNYGKALKKEDRRGGQFAVYGSSGIVGMHDASLVEGPGIIVGRKGNVGTVFWCEDDFFVIDTAYFVTSALPLRFLVYVLPTLNFINSDAAVPGLSRNQAYTLDILVPPAPLLAKFCALADTFEQQASTLQRKIQNLCRTRDLLLPRLLAGNVTSNSEEL